MIDSEKILSAVHAINNGVKAHLSLEPLNTEELQRLASSLPDVTTRLNGRANDRAALIDGIITGFDEIEAIDTTSYTPGGLSAVLGGGGNLNKRLRRAKIPDAAITEAHFISPSEHVQRLGLHEHKGMIAAVYAILKRLCSQVTRHPDIPVNGELTPPEKVVCYGHKPESGQYTYYSDPNITSWILEQLHLYPPSHFISPSEHARRLGIKSRDHIEADIFELLEKLCSEEQKHPDILIDGKLTAPEQMVRYGHMPGSPNYTYYSDPEIGKWLLEQLNIRPPEHFLTPSQHAIRLGITSHPHVEAHIAALLEKLCAKDPPHPDIPIYGQLTPPGKLVFYDQKRESRRGTYYSDPAIDSWLLEHLNLPLPRLFITPSDQAMRLGLEEQEDAEAAIASVLARLCSKEIRHPDIMIDGTLTAPGKVARYGHKEGSEEYTYYSHPSIGSWLLEELDRFPPKPLACKLINVHKLCINHLHVTYDQYSARIKAIAGDALAHPDKYKDLPGKPDELIKFYRAQNNSVALFVSPDLCPWLEKQLGLYPLLRGSHEHLERKSTKIRQLGMRNDKKSIDDLSTFLTKELLENPDRVINTDTGRILKDAIIGLRPIGHGNVIYLHDDMDGYLSKNWLAPKPLGEEGKKWLTGRKLLWKIAFRLYPTGAIEAVQELLGEIRKTSAMNTIRIGEEEKCIGDMIRRFSSGGTGTAYYLHEDAVESGLITKAMVLERVQQMQQRPSVNAK